MKNDILEKLRSVLEEDIKGEPQVVYILSRIRKILEVDDTKREFKVLKFYCDWALHARIDKTMPDQVLTLAKEAAAGNEVSQSRFFSFKLFYDNLKKFLIQYSLPINICERGTNKTSFSTYLSQIYSDTPLVVKIVRTQIKWTHATSNDLGYGGNIEIKNLD